MARISQWQVAVAAEAAVAMVFARAGWNVAVQYGANQPEYDLMVDDGRNSFKISVKGSQDGSWGLTQSLLENANYHAAADAWLARHTPRTIYAFAQFKGIELPEAPRIYLATPAEVADRLKRTANGRGDTILYERKEWTKRAVGAGTVDAIPTAWRFSLERIEELCSYARNLAAHASTP
jgi:hypothetical protein